MCPIHKVGFSEGLKGIGKAKTRLKSATKEVKAAPKLGFQT